jgi:hypothetical protein
MTPAPDPKPHGRGVPTRRAFLEISGLALAATVERGATGAGAAAVATDPEPNLFDRPLRWVQLTLTEQDPATADLGFWLDYFRAIHADAACLNAGGCVAFYPTRVPFHHRSAFMKPGDDPFGTLVRGCRAMGMSVVIARVDPHSIRDVAAEAHPEWVAVEADGQKRRHWAAPGRWVTCASGSYNFEFMTGVIREIVSSYEVDGVFANRWQGHGLCYCDVCRDLFRKASGLDLPRPGRPDEARARAAWERWHHQRMIALARHWDSAIRKIRPQGAFIANAGPTELGVGDEALKPRIFLADRQSRDARVVPPWLNGRNAKEYRAVGGRTPVGGLFSIGRDDQYRWKDAVQNGPELRVWIAEAIAHGMRPWMNKFAATLHDRRWLPVVEEVYRWHWRHQRYFRNTEPLARVAIVQSPQSAGHGDQQAHEFGFHQALVEGRIPFELVHERRLDPEHLDRFKLLVLPDAARLSDVQCAQLRSFVARGGSLLAAFETSLYDEKGHRRPDFGLADLFGVRYAGKVETLVKNCYMRVDASTRHPVLHGLEDAGWIINTIERVAVEPTVPPASLPLTRVPPFPDLPMEEVYPREPVTSVAEIYLREFGKGRVVYFPGDIGRTFWEIFDADHARLLASAARWALNEAPVVSVSGPGVVDLAVWRQEQSMTVHLVNLTNPMMMKGPFRELIPVGKQTVRVRLPAGTKAKSVRLLALDASAQVEEHAGEIRLDVPSVLVHEVVAIDLAKSGS